jgi:hypothetical protein
MFFTRIAWALAAFVLLAGAPHVEAQTARAEVLRTVQIDGDLSDWPEGMVRYPLRTKVITRNTGLEDADLSASEDLSPQFRVGYDPDENLIYVAIEVRDDQVVIGNNYDNTDATEVYVNGDDESPMQYAVVPGGGGSYNIGGPNPHLYQGDIHETRTRVAYGRRGDVTIYEWVLEAFDEYPERPMQLTPGRKLLFDVVAIDRDPGEDGHGFVAWGPNNSQKYGGANRVGRLELGGISMQQSAWWMDHHYKSILEDIVDGMVAILILFSIGGAIGLAIKLARGGGKGHVRPEVVGDINDRLDTIEQRLTDTQDVMIALSEKYDRLDGLEKDRQ